MIGINVVIIKFVGEDFFPSADISNMGQSCISCGCCNVRGKHFGWHRTQCINVINKLNDDGLKNVILRPWIV